MYPPFEFIAFVILYALAAIEFITFAILYPLTAIEFINGSFIVLFT